MADNTLRITPRISEQTYTLANKQNVFVFNVPMSANKAMIKDAVQSQFDVTVLKVNVTVVKGKMKASNRRGQRPVMGARASVKKAFVTLKDGDSIDTFEGLE